MAFHRVAFAEDVISEVSSISPALLYDDMNFPPLQDGWQLLNEADAEDYHHAFVHKVVPQEWDWQCITKEHRPALYAQVASRALDTDSTTTLTLPIAKPARRRSSLLRKATDAWHSTCESQHDLGDELHGQYKSSHRRLRRSMKLSAKQRPRRQRYPSVVLDHHPNMDEQGHKRRQRSTKRSSTSSSNNKKIALEQGLDWVVSFP
ncbi:hypothetical protein K492DRAFT_175030 [Lichtheimia hyalospora FSU 10163]|nr:hypothetical protein K492DRAFT_175030 [Lichtheimia hyalospora FSU 10163]